MTVNTYAPAKTGFSRIFLVKGGVKPSVKPTYEAFMAMGGIESSYGDIKDIDVPNPNRRGDFITIGQTRDASDRPTTTISGRYASEIKSTMLQLAKAGSSVDVFVVLHSGACSSPADFDTYTKIIWLEGAYISKHSLDTLGTLASDGNSSVDETVDLSAKEVYEFVRLGWAEYAKTQISNEVLDAAIYEAGGCTDGNTSDVLVVSTKAAGGSPSTPADVLFSVDDGVTWYARDIDTMAITSDADGVAIVGSYVAVVSQADASMHYAALSDFVADGVPTWTKITTGVVSGGEPTAVFGRLGAAWAVGAGGYIYSISDVTAGMTVQSAGALVTDTLNAVHAYSGAYAVAVGNNSAILKTTDGTSWEQVTTPPTGVGINYLSVFMLSKKAWFIGTSAGDLYYTEDSGATWTLKAFSGSGSGSVTGVYFSNAATGWISHTTAATAGRVLQTNNGGYSWIVMPSTVGSLPTSDGINVVVGKEEDPNFVVAGGLGSDGSDGFLLVGKA